MKAFNMRNGQFDLNGGKIGFFQLTLEFADDDPRELAELGSILEIVRCFVPTGGRLDVALEGHRLAIGAHERAAYRRAAAAAEDAKTMGEVRWGYALEREPKKWTGDFATRDEAVEEGRRVYGPMTPFFVIWGTRPHPTTFFTSAQLELEKVAECADDEVGAPAAGWPPKVSDESKAEFDAFVRTWSAKHVPVSFWLPQGDPEAVSG